MSDRSTGHTTDTIYLQQLEERIRARAERDRQDLAAVLSTPEGRRLVRRWLRDHKLFETITGEAPWIWVASGTRDAGLRMLAEITSHETLYLLMEEEAQRLAKTETAEDAAYAAYQERVRQEEEGAGGP